MSEGLTVSIVYARTEELGPDPLDETAHTPRRMGDVVDESCDVVVIWREWGDQFIGGSRTHVVSGGSWAFIADEQVEDVVSRLLEAD